MEISTGRQAIYILKEEEGYAPSLSQCNKTRDTMLGKRRGDTLPVKMLGPNVYSAIYLVFALYVLGSSLVNGKQGRVCVP